MDLPKFLQKRLLHLPFLCIFAAVNEFLNDMETLFKKHKILISQVSMDIVRDFVNKVSWEKQLVAIRGSRGVGKTTLMRQYVRQHYGVQPGEALYCVLDSQIGRAHV